jgi:hypothetical protein
VDGTRTVVENEGKTPDGSCHDQHTFSAPGLIGTTEKTINEYNYVNAQLTLEAIIQGAKSE